MPYHSIAWGWKQPHLVVLHTGWPKCRTKVLLISFIWYLAGSRYINYESSKQKFLPIEQNIIFGALGILKINLGFSTLLLLLLLLVVILSEMI